MRLLARVELEALGWVHGGLMTWSPARPPLTKEEKERRLLQLEGELRRVQGLGEGPLFPTWPLSGARSASGKVSNGSMGK